MVPLPKRREGQAAVLVLLCSTCPFLEMFAGCSACFQSVWKHTLPGFTLYGSMFAWFHFVWKHVLQDSYRPQTLATFKVWRSHSMRKKSSVNGQSVVACYLSSDSIVIVAGW